MATCDLLPGTIVDMRLEGISTPCLVVNQELGLKWLKDAIADVLSAADEEIELLSKERGYIAEQRKFLLNGLINGKIRVPESVREKQLEVANA